MDDREFREVLDAARHGYEHSFTLLFRDVQPVLLRYLRTIGQGLGGATADDVAAETWVQVVRGLGRFRGEQTGFRAWVFTIARARLVDARRQASRLPTPRDTELLLVDLPAEDDVVQVVEALASTEAALQVIRRLPPGQAEVVLLRYVAGLDVERTAEVLGKRPATVRVTAHRALRRLEELVGADARSVVTELVTESVTERGWESVRHR
jgi:RNA polymerase sigma-70 factor (ECF subfamily)